MFKVGDNIIHGGSGACRVENVGALNTGVKGRIYYTLIPYYVKGKLSPIKQKSLQLISKDACNKKLQAVFGHVGGVFPK